MKHIKGPKYSDERYTKPNCDEQNCEQEGCQSCCPHDERDHYICLDCGHESDPGDDIDRAMDAIELIQDNERDEK